MPLVCHPPPDRQEAVWRRFAEEIAGPIMARRPAPQYGRWFRRSADRRQCCYAYQDGRFGGRKYGARRWRTALIGAGSLEVKLQFPGPPV
jgi:hypothetical protein